MTEEEIEETEEEETEEEKKKKEIKNRLQRYNTYFDDIKKYLQKINIYNDNYKNIFKKKDGTHLQERFAEWIKYTYKKDGKLNHDYDSDIYKIKGLYKLLKDNGKTIMETNAEDIIKTENKKQSTIEKEIKDFDALKKNAIEKINKFISFHDKYNMQDLKTKTEEQLQQQSEGYEKKISQQQQQAQQQQQQHEQEMKQKEEERKQDIAERNRLENERAANIKHKAYEEGKEEGSKHSIEEIRKILAEDRRMEAERNQAQKDYIMSKVRDGIYKLPKQKIVEIVKKDIEDKKITTDDPEKMADTIYWESVNFINKHKRTIARLSTLQGYNPTQFEQLPPTVHQAVNDYITDKWEEDIARKNRKYLLPKDLPRWERAVQQHNVNPMLGRGAWSN